MRRHDALKDLGRSLVSIVTLVVLLGGVPIALAQLAGWPLPHDLPDPSQVLRALGRTEIGDATLIKGAALVCWGAWLALTLCFLVEVVAWFRGRTARRVPLVGSLQPWVARTVASSLLVASSIAGLVRPAVAASVPPRAAVGMVVEMNPRPPSLRPAAPVRTRAVPVRPASAKVYVVQPPHGRQRDTLWGIAERHLGDPTRWPEVFALNKGRFTAGHTVSNPHWIYPGEELLLPSDAVGLEPVPQAAAVVSPPTVDTGPLADAPTTTTTAPVTTAPAAPDMRIIPDGASVAPMAGVGTDVGRIAHDISDLLPATPSGMALAGAGILASGVVAGLDRRRRAQRRRRVPGDAIVVPDPALAGVEAALRSVSEPNCAVHCGLALRVLALSSRAAGIVLPAVLAVRVSSAEMEVTFVEPPHRLPPPFVPGQTGWWTLPKGTVTDSMRAAAERAGVKLPPLFTIGSVDGGSLMVNVAAVDTIAIEGDRVTALGLLHAAAVELAHSAWIETGQLVLVGFGGRLRELPHVRTVDSLAALRGLGSDDRSTVVLCAARPTDGVPARGISWVVADRLPQAGHRLQARPGLIDDGVLNMTAVPPQLSSDDVGAIVRLLSSAEVDAEAPARLQSVPSLAVDRPPVLSTVGEPPEVEVRVLGPVEIVGGEAPITRAKSVELVAYLAMHRDAVIDADRLREALWPGRPPGGTLYTTASVARGMLGRAADGALHVPVLAGGERLYRLHTSVASDVDRFTAAVRRAANESAEVAMDTLRAALELVRGRPFTTKGREWLWPHTEGHLAILENDAAMAAHRLAQLCLDAGDAEGARWAIRRGLLANPGNEQLFRDAMLAADLLGNVAGVEAVFAELVKLAEADAPFDDQLHPRTIELYERLTRRSAVL